MLFYVENEESSAKTNKSSNKIVLNNDNNLGFYHQCNVYLLCFNFISFYFYFSFKPQKDIVLKLAISVKHTVVTLYNIIIYI